MFWNEMLHPSLKLRIAFSYALLFLISCSGIILLIFFFMHCLFYRGMEKHLEQIAEHSKKVHIIGTKLQMYNEILAPEAYPEDDFNVLKQQFHDLQIVYVGSRHIPSANTDDKKILTAFAIHDGKYYEMRVQKKEKSVYSKWINTENNRFRLKTYFSRLLVSSGQENLFIAFYDHNGKNLLQFGNNILSDTQYKQLCSSKKLTVFSHFAYKKFTLSDGNFLLIGVNIRNFQQWNTIVSAAGVVLLLIIAAAGAVSAWVLTGRFIRGITRTTLAMHKIRSGNYGYRVRALHSEDKEIRELVQTFNDMNEKTENLLQELKMVTDNVAHDLRTPLTRISGIIELLLTDRNLPDHVQTDCVSIAEEVNRLKNVVTTIMDISRTNSRPGEIRKEQIDFVAFLRDFCEFFEPVFGEKNLKLYLSLPDNCRYIHADKNLLQRLLSNLMENALKFTEKGFVSVSLNSDEKQLFLRIADSGCGIAEKDLTQIFKRFYRSDASRHLQGNGLGLALVDAIVKAHQWKINVTSCVGEGTVFLITIDLPDTTLQVTAE